MPALNTSGISSAGRRPVNNRRLAFYIAAVALQAIIIASVPLPTIQALWHGRTVILKVEPYDPYDIMGGYYAQLGYDISRKNAFSTTTLDIKRDTRIYAVIKEGATQDAPWKPVSLGKSPPVNLPPNQVFLCGTYNGRRVSYGIEKFYFSEEQRDSIEQDLSTTPILALAEVKVDPSGRSALVRLRVGNRIYQTK